MEGRLSKDIVECVAHDPMRGPERCRKFYTLPAGQFYSCGRRWDGAEWYALQDFYFKPFFIKCILFYK